jgi:hypothetical protein
MQITIRFANIEYPALEYNRQTLTDENKPLEKYPGSKNQN